MIWLSVCDGIASGRIAAERSGLPVTRYYASEINKPAISVANHNYPDIIHIGDIRDIKASELPNIDILIGGTPCTDLSCAGRGEGIIASSLEEYLFYKQMNADFGKNQSYLFWEYVRLLKELKPKWFLLENVHKMKKTTENIITEVLGVQPHLINASLVSAQNRKRFYWSNIPGITQPKDKGIFLKDIVSDFTEDLVLTNPNEIDWITDSYRLKKKRTQINGDKAIPLIARQYASWNGNYIMYEITQDNNSDGLLALDEKTSLAYSSGKEKNKPILLGNTNPCGRGMNGTIHDINGKAPTLTTNKGEGRKIGCIRVGTANDINGHDYNKRVYSIDGKSPCITVNSSSHNPKIALTNIYYRKLSPEECEELQTITRGYTSIASPRQRYIMTGNAWPVDVVVHIFKALKIHLDQKAENAAFVFKLFDNLKEVNRLYVTKQKKMQHIDKQGKLNHNITAAPINWFGSKSKLVKKITAYFPEHTTFVDVFGGSGSILLGKRPSKVEVYNDINHKLVSLFRVLADKDKTHELVRRLEYTPYARSEFEFCRDNINLITDEIELARMMLVVYRQSFASLGNNWSYSVGDSKMLCSSSVRKFRAGIERLKNIHHRIRRVQIENLPWQQILEKYDRESTLFYLDPPYVPDTRVNGTYEYEMTNADHIILVNKLLSIKGSVVLSGYAHEIYSPLESAGWKRINMETVSHVHHNTKSKRIESLWLSPKCQAKAQIQIITEPREKLTRQTHAYSVHQQRIEASTSLISDAIRSLRKIGHKVTHTEVARLTGISRVHISRRYKDLF